MRVGGAHQGELVGIDAELLFQLETIAERRERILVLQHLRLFCLAHIQVAFIPPLVISKFVIWRKKGMGLAITFYLGGFVEALPVCALFGIFAVDGFASKGFDQWKHGAVRKISVVRDCEYFSTGLLFVSGHPLPQVTGVVAAIGRSSRVGFDLAGFAGIVAKDQVAV